LIDKALDFLRAELNAYLKLKTGDDKKINLSAIVDQAGSSVVTEATIGMMMVNVEEERTMREQMPQTVMVNGQYAFINPELRLNLYVLFASHHTDHPEALKLLSHIVRFFQGKNVFENLESPQLGEEIEKLIVDLYTLSFEQQNQLWASLGAKYMPSLVYRVRMVVINEKRAVGLSPAISSVDTSFAVNNE
jgi:hypothetical protein